MVSVHPRPVLERETTATSSRLTPTYLGPDRSFLATIKWWRWWKPIFIIMVSAVTVLDQFVASWMTVNYMWSGMSPCSACIAPKMAFVV